jgi:probable rRNA maturation factor
MTRTVLHHEGVGRAVVTVVFVTRQKIKALNKRFLGRDYVTDVLAFNSGDAGFSRRAARRKPKTLMGDVVISTDAALKNAGMYGVSVSREMALYIVHGLLHLLGYDDHSPADITRMRRREEDLLKFLGADVEKIS